jgi:NCS1 family nucleobase:cation symporter-1
VGGILIVDYYFIRKQQLDVVDLYKKKGIYTFSNGFNRAAVIALILGIIPNVPGFLITIKVLAEDSFPYWVGHLYNYAWFVGFFVSGILYYLFMNNEKVFYQEKSRFFSENNENPVLDFD